MQRSMATMQSPGPQAGVSRVAPCVAAPRASVRGPRMAVRAAASSVAKDIRSDAVQRGRLGGWWAEGGVLGAGLMR